MIVVFLSEWRKLNMALVGIVMGSDSDMPVMAKAAEILEQLGIEYEMTIISAHREPDVFFEYAKSAEAKGFKVIIAGAGKCAHLAGNVCGDFSDAGHRYSDEDVGFGGVDSLYSIVQMPSGIPVADGGDQRRTKCGNSCSKDFGHIRSCIAGASEKL